MQSAANQSPHSDSLLTGKLTGNFAKSGLSVAISCPINARIQCLTAEFPAQQNREFSNAYQGILDCTPGGEQGLGFWIDSLVGVFILEFDRAPVSEHRRPSKRMATGR